MQPPDTAERRLPPGKTAAHQSTSTTATIPPPAAYVSLLWPSARRTRWWYLVRCATCGTPHLGRAAALADVTCVRRLPCGHRVRVIVARAYGRPGGEA